MSLTEFLLERIAEDAARAGRLAGSTLLSEQLRSGRALAEYKAKQRIVQQHMSSGRREWAEACAILASIYAEHPHYREEWPS